MYTQEFKDTFRSKFVEMVRDSELFEGVIQVGGPGKSSASGKSGGQSLFTHVPLSACLYDKADMERGEAEVRSFAERYGNAYIQRTIESPEHIKLDTFIEGGLNVTLHIEVTSSLRIKSENYEILLDKTGNIQKTAHIGSEEEEKRIAKKEAETDKTNSVYYGIFYPLRRCEQNLIRGDLFTAELHLSEARLELMKMRGRIDGINLRAAFPAYGNLNAAFLEKLKGTYACEISERAIADAAQTVIDLYEENVSLDGNEPDKRLYYLFYGEKLPKETKDREG